jgi:hypothetical protein
LVNVPVIVGIPEYYLLLVSVELKTVFSAAYVSMPA